MSESASTNSLMTRPVSPITDDDQDLFRSFLNGPEEFTLHPLGSSSSGASLSPRARPNSVEEQDVENLPENPVRHAPGLRNLISDWSPELFALVSSAVSLCALIILLDLQDGQPLSTWTLPLSLNTAVSLLSVMIKTPLAFVVGTCLGQGKWAWFSKRQGPLSAFVAIEEAGRGPLGSLALIWKLKFRNWVSFGAGITIGLLAIDPFLQGLVQYEGKMSTMVDSNASIMRSHGLDVGEWYGERLSTSGRGFSTRCYSDTAPDIGLSLATQIGFANASILRPVQPPGLSCRTGNCTWPAFSTLGICSSCANISSRVRKAPGEDVPCSPTEHLRKTTLYNIRSDYRPDIYSPALLRVDGYVNESYGCLTSVRGDWKTDTYVSFRPNDIHSFRNWDTLLASFTVMHTQEEYWSNKVKWNDTKVYATECALQYCIQVNRPTMESGKIDEVLIPAPFERVSSSWQSEETDPRALEAIERTIGTSLAVVGEDKCVVPRSDLQLRLLDQDNWLEPRDIRLTFNITQRSITTMMNGLDYETINFINRALSNSTNITATFDNVAHLMSYQMRDTNGSTVQGYTREWVIYIRVRWPLISGPVVLLLATILFSGWVLMESRGIELETFKSEPLEMLLYGFDSKSRDHLRATRKAGQNVEGKMIQLEEAAEGPELRLKDGAE